MMNEEIIRKIHYLAESLRRDIVEMIGCDGGPGHLGGSCSCADIVAALYGHRLKYDPHNPGWEGRDKLLFSKGHAILAQYAAMAEVGYFDRAELHTVKRLGSRLQGHPDMLKLPGIEAGTGSLGQGLSIACGMALAMRLDGRTNNKVFCIMGDGELAEGQIWEAAMAATHYRLDNLVGIVDCNGLQATGAVKDVLNSAPLNAKWAAFGWHVLEINGHDVGSILRAFGVADAVKGRPAVILARTIKSKGVSFAENRVEFHNGGLTKAQYEQALDEIGQRLALYADKEAAL